MLDLTKLTDAVTKVAKLATDHAATKQAYDDASSERHAARVERDAALEAIAKAQADIDALTSTLIAAAGSPAEATGIAAVADALFVAPAPTIAPVIPAINPAAPPLPPLAPTPKKGQSITFLPGDPRANL
jgi:hypothetical protein